MSDYEAIIQVVNNQENLVPVTHGVINGEEVIAVDAKELHFFLEIKTPFNKWITRRIEDYGFVDDIDFKTFLSQSNGGRPGYEYHVSLDMAKELSMVERNNKGREARKYFLEMEKKAISIAQPKIPANFSEALQLAADQAKQLELQAPKVEFADTIIESKGSVSIGEFAKIHGEYGRNIMFKILRGEGILMKDNVPYQKYVSEGYFELTEKDTPVGIKAVTRITGKGQAWLTMRLNKLKDN